jgi:hypothetical protein
MTITYLGGSFGIDEGDRPDQPLDVQRVNATAPQRGPFGAIYDPVVYSFNRYDFSFSKIRLAAAQNFKAMFEAVSEFRIEDPGELGTLNLLLVPGTVRIEYFEFNTASVFFTVEDEEAIA